MADDLLGALMTYLKAAPTILAVLTDASGNPAVFTDDTWPGESYPYLVIGAYEERDPGMSLDDSSVTLTVVVVHNISLDATRTVSAIVKNAIDSIAINPNSVRVARLTWTGGIETGVIRNRSRPRKIKGRGGTVAPVVWREDIDYEFDTSPT